MALQFITQGILERNNVDDGYGSPPGAILNLPYDFGFIGGFDDDMVAEVVTARTYGQMIMGRAGTFIGCYGYMDSAPAGYTIIDIEKNGTSIYSLTAIARVNITAGGSSYSSVPTVAFSGGGGTGATGTAVISVKPDFHQTNDLTNPDASLSVISNTAFTTGDRITFKVITLGATPGSGMRVTLKCKV